MKIGMNEIVKSIYNVASDKIKRELKKEGFEIISGYDSKFDIFAQKGEEKRIYELKLGKNRIQTKQFIKLQEKAKELNAKLFIVYLEIPKSKDIYFDGLEDIIYDDLSEDMPSEIDEISTHSSLECIDNIEINEINFSKGKCQVAGTGTVFVYLQFGSNSDVRSDNGLYDSKEMDFFFRLTIDVFENKVLQKYYKIDTSI